MQLWVHGVCHLTLEHLCARCLNRPAGRPAARGGLRRPSAEWQRRQAAALKAKSQPLSMFNTAHPCQLAAILESPPAKPTTSAGGPGATKAAADEPPQQTAQQAGASCNDTAAKHGVTASSEPDKAVSSPADKAEVGAGSAKEGLIGITAATPLPHVVYTEKGDSEEGRSTT